MSLTTLTIGGVDYEVYASLAEAAAVLTADPVRRSAWTAASDDDKSVYLVAATGRLDLLNWMGEPIAAPGGRAWPRTGLKWPDDTDVASDSIPAPVERATALLAGSIALRPAQADHGQSQAQAAIQELKAGSVTVKYAAGGASAATIDTSPLQDETAYQLVRMWVGGGDVIFAPVASGTGTAGESTFTDRDRFGFSRGV